MTNTPYTAHLRVGAHSWDVDSDDPADYGPTSDLRFSWQARQDDGWPTQHDPTILTFGVVVAAGEDFDDVDQGTTVHFTFTPDGYAAPLVTFGGTVRDLVARPHSLGMVYEITAVDHLQKLQEDYTISAFMANGESTDLMWPRLLQDAGGAGLGTGIRPAMPDPLSGDVKPLTGFGGFWGAAFSFEEEPAWNVFTGISAASPLKAGATPLYQRLVFTYQLDGAGDLDAAHPFEGTWLPQGIGNAPQELVDGPDGWTVGGGNVDGCLMPTDGTEWSRPRIEPNVVINDDFGTTWERAHTGPDIVRHMTNTPPFLGTFTDGIWVTSGVETADQWSSELEVVASEDPDTVAGWFTLPSALRVAVAAYSIDSRHTPSGRTEAVGMLGAASLSIRPGGSWRVGFHLRRTLPDYSGASTGGWSMAPDALTYADVAADHPTLTYADIDPALTYRDLTFL